MPKNPLDNELFSALSGVLFAVRHIMLAVNHMLDTNQAGVPRVKFGHVLNKLLYSDEAFNVLIRSASDPLDKLVLDLLI